MRKEDKGSTLAKATRRIKGFSLVEALLVILYIGIFAVIAVPRLNRAIISKYKAEATAKKIVAALRRVRGLALSNAATNTTGFALWMDGSGGAGLRTLYEIQDRSTVPPTTVDQHTIDSDIAVWSDKQTIRFGPLGNILESPSGGYPSQITVSAEGKTFTIGLVTGTGTITCTEN